VLHKLCCQVVTQKGRATSTVARAHEGHIDFCFCIFLSSVPKENEWGWWYGGVWIHVHAECRVGDEKRSGDKRRRPVVHHDNPTVVAVRN
jgi:hypothetical protein